MEILRNLTSRPWSKFNLVTRPSSTQRAAGDVLPRSRWYLFSGSGMAMKLVKHLKVLLLYIMCIYIYIYTQKYCALNVRTSRIALFSKRRAVTTSPPMKFQTAEHRKFLGSLNLSQGAPPLAEIYTPCPESTNVFMTPTGRNGPKVQMLGLLACDRLLAWLKNSQLQFQ